MIIHKEKMSKFTPKKNAFCEISPLIYNDIIIQYVNSHNKHIYIDPYI